MYNWHRSVSNLRYLLPLLHSFSFFPIPSPSTAFPPTFADEGDVSGRLIITTCGSSVDYRQHSKLVFFDKQENFRDWRQGSAFPLPHPWFVGLWHHQDSSTFLSQGPFSHADFSAKILHHLWKSWDMLSFFWNLTSSIFPTPYCLETFIHSSIKTCSSATPPKTSVANGPSTGMLNCVEYQEGRRWGGKRSS